MRLFGYSPAEAIGQPITLIIPPERRDEEGGILNRLRRGERIEHYETVRVAKDGRRLDISLTVSPIRDLRGQVIGASKVARDITDRKRAEDRYRQAATSAAQAAESNAKFRTFFEQGTNFAGVLSLDGVVIEANRLCLDACGFTPRGGHRKAVLGGVAGVEPFAGPDGDDPQRRPPGGCRAGVLNGEQLLCCQRRRAGVGPDPQAPVTNDAGRHPVHCRHQDRTSPSRKQMEDALRQADREEG